MTLWDIKVCEDMLKKQQVDLTVAEAAQIMSGSMNKCVWREMDLFPELAEDSNVVFHMKLFAQNCSDLEDVERIWAIDEYVSGLEQWQKEEDTKKRRKLKKKRLKEKKKGLG